MVQGILRKCPPEKGLCAWIGFPALGFVLIGLVAALIYSNSLNTSFHLDDGSSIVDNPRIHIQQLTLSDLKEAARGNRPVSSLTYALNYYFGRLDPFGYHAVNVVVHALTGCVVYLFLLPLFGPGRRLFALLGSLVWLVHPVQTQAVTYVVQRDASLSALFFLSALWLYGRGREGVGIRRTLSFLGVPVFGLLAIAAKEVAVVLPLALLLYEYYFGSRQDSGLFFNNLRKMLPALLGLVVILMFYVLSYTHFSSVSWETWFSRFLSVFTKNYASVHLPFWERLLTEFRVVVFYISLLFWPHPSRLSIEHDFILSSGFFSPATTFLSFSLLLALVVFAVRRAKDYPLVSFGILWFFLTLALESFVLRLDLAYEHRLYLPSVGFVLALCSGLGRFWERLEAEGREAGARLLVGALLTVMLIFSFWTFQRNQVWKDEVSLWSDAVQKAPRSTRAHNNLGNAYSHAGEWDLAAREFKAALDLEPRVSLYRDNLSRMYERLGRLDRALSLYLYVIERNPNNARAYYNLGRIFEKQGNLGSAKQVLLRSVELDGRYAKPYGILASVYARLGEYGRAAETYESLLEMLSEQTFDVSSQHMLALPDDEPDRPVVHYQLGQVYEKLDRPQEAMEQYEEAVRLFPGFLPVRMDLARLYARQAKYEKAAEQYRHVLKNYPDTVEAHFYLGFVYELQNHFQKAVYHYREFLESGEERPVNAQNREMALQRLAALTKRRP